MQLALGRTSGLTAQRLRSALAALRAPPGGPQALFAQPRSALEAIGLPPAVSAAMLSWSPAALSADRALVEREQIVLIDALSPLYPPLLAQIPSAPALLYVKGAAACLSSPQLSMVGSRNPTPAGRRTAREFAAELSRRGLTITSGLAEGIDAASHLGALESGGKTIAVLATGIDAIYPPQHRELAARIASQGALVSQFPPRTAPIRANFPRRNRIISGLAAGTLVVEAAPSSGSLITARLAKDQGREVFSIPGSIHNPLARGCHGLIRAGAKLVECADDVLRELKYSFEKQPLMEVAKDRGGGGVGAATLDKGYKILLDAVGYEPTSIDSLVARTGLPSQSIASMLLILELEGAVGMHAGGRYLRLFGTAELRAAKSIGIAGLSDDG